MQSKDDKKIKHALGLQSASPPQSSHMRHIMGPPCGAVKLTSHSDLTQLVVDGSMLTFKVIRLPALRESKSPPGHSAACLPFKYLSITAFNSLPLLVCLH